MTSKKTITIKKEVMEKIELQAKKENRNFSNMIETMCLYYLQNN